MSATSSRAALALALLAAPLGACEFSGLALYTAPGGEPGPVRMGTDLGFGELVRHAGLPSARVFAAYRAAHQLRRVPCTEAPGREHQVIEFDLTRAPPPPPADLARLRVRRGIPAASFFHRMPMDTWRTPYDGQWGVSRGGGRRRHKGIDMHAPEGTPIYAVAPGTVVRAWNSKGIERDGGYGNYVILEHNATDASGLHYWTYYTHMRDNPTVAEGDRVAAGQQLGTVGRTPIGRFTNPHNHFEVRLGDGSELGLSVNTTPFGAFRARFEEFEGAY